MFEISESRQISEERTARGVDICNAEIWPDITECCWIGSIKYIKDENDGFAASIFAGMSVWFVNFICLIQG